MRGYSQSSLFPPLKRAVIGAVMCTRWCNEQLTTAFFLRASIDVAGKYISRVLATVCVAHGWGQRREFFFQCGELFHLPSFLTSSPSGARFLWIAHGELQDRPGVALHYKLAELPADARGHAYCQWEDELRREGGATIHGGETQTTRTHCCKPRLLPSAVYLRMLASTGTTPWFELSMIILHLDETTMQKFVKKYLSEFSLSTPPHRKLHRKHCLFNWTRCSEKLILGRDDQSVTRKYLREWENFETYESEFLNYEYSKFLNFNRRAMLEIQKELKESLWKIRVSRDSKI